MLIPNFEVRQVRDNLPISPFTPNAKGCKIGWVDFPLHRGPLYFMRSLGYQGDFYINNGKMIVDNKVMK